MVGNYGVSYTIDGCSSAATYFDLAIDNVFDYQKFKFPNVITANGDGKNDEINLEDYVGPCAEFVLTIRDRWGSEVYRQERGGESFKGLSVDGRELPEGVYFYRFIFDQDDDVSGFMHIVRGQ
jgi:gliding motility-associated-like protein